MHAGARLFALQPQVASGPMQLAARPVIKKKKSSAVAVSLASGASGKKIGKGTKSKAAVGQLVAKALEDMVVG